MMGGFGMGFMWIFWVAVIVIVIAFAWSYTGKGKRNGNSVPSAIDVLKQRYARERSTGKSMRKREKI